MKLRAFCLIAGVVCTTAIGAACAAPRDAIETAAASMQKGEYSDAIRLLTQALEQPGLPLEDQAHILLNRGFAYDEMGDYDRAIADYSKVISLKPDAWQIYFRRGLAYRENGEFQQALADIDTAMAPKTHPPSDGTFLFGERGVVEFALGHFTEADKDFSKVLTLDPTDQYAMLWLQVTRNAAGQMGKAATGKAANAPGEAVTGPSEWPAPLLALYRGKSDIAQVRTAVAQENSGNASSQDCEANFFLAEYDLKRGDVAAAKPLLRDVQDFCSSKLAVHAGAQGELERLAK